MCPPNLIGHPNLLALPIPVSWPSQSYSAPQSLGLPIPVSLLQQQADNERGANASANATGSNATSASTSLIVGTAPTEESSAGELAASQSVRPPNPLFFSQSLRPPNPLFFDSPNHPSSPHSLFVSCRPKLALASIGKDARKDGTYAEPVQAVCR